MQEGVSALGRHGVSIEGSYGGGDEDGETQGGKSRLCGRGNSPKGCAMISEFSSTGGSLLLQGSDEDIASEWYTI